MTALLPIRVSIYDFLYEDTQPIDAVMADFGHLSLPQSKIIRVNGIQAITSQLLAFNQVQGSSVVLKKIFSRNQIKELRKHNAFNFSTMKTAIQQGPSVFEALFNSKELQQEVTSQLALLADLKVDKVRPIIAALTLLCLRELAILMDFAHLDSQEIEEWFNMQSQFLSLNRTNVNPTQHPIDGEIKVLQAPPINPKWFEITDLTLSSSIDNIETDQTPHYAKVIGRTIHKSPTEPLIVDEANHSDVLTFCKMTNISLPYQRWLLQFAKISDIYISRNRLKIAPEPVQPPARPLVSFAFMDKENINSNNAAESSHNEVPSQPIWKNPVMLMLVLVIGVLGLMAIGKFQYKKAHMSPVTQTTQSINVPPTDSQSQQPLNPVPLIIDPITSTH